MSEIELHRKLLGDRRRNDTLAQALAQSIDPGKTTMLDLGAGTGFLSFLARRLGARHCTLVEYSEALELARRIARRNGITGLSYIKSHSAEVDKRLQVDLIVSETLGNYALEENLLETLLDARRFLRPGGRMIPCALRQYVAPVTAPRLQAEIDIWPGIGHGLDLSPARELSLNNMYVKTVHAADLGGSERSARRWDEILFEGEPSSLRRSTVHWGRGELPAAEVHGFCLWWEVEWVPGLGLSTSPFAPPTHWEQVYLPLLQPLQLEAQDRIELTLTSDTRWEVGVRVGWRTVQHRGRERVLDQEQDSLRGRL